MPISKELSATLRQLIANSDQVEELVSAIDSAEDGGGGGGSLPDQTGHAKQFLSTNGTSPLWDTSISTDLSGIGSGNHTGLHIIGGATTKPTKLILTNTNSAANWSVMAFDSSHGPIPGAFAITSEGNGQALYIDKDTLEVYITNGATFGNAVTVDSAGVLPTSSGDYQLGNDSLIWDALYVYSPVIQAQDNSGAVTLATPNGTTSYDLTFPAAQGSVGQTLVNSDGAGNLVWASGSGITWSTPVNANIVPDTTGNYDIGSAASTFDGMYSNTFLMIDETNAISTAFLSGPPGGSVAGFSDIAAYLNVLSPSNNGNVSTYRNFAIAFLDEATADASPAGSLYLTSGNKTAGTGNGGDIVLKTGVGFGGGAIGKIKLVNGSEGTAGWVWTSTDVNGSGEWQAPSASIQAFGTYYQIYNSSAVATDIFGIDSISEQFTIAVPTVIQYLRRPGGSVNTIDLSNFQIKTPDDIVRIDWTGTLNDDAGLTSVQFSSRQLIDAAGSTVLDWSSGSLGATGSFTTTDLKTVTVVNGLITSITP